jgi:hypothetical protein
MQRVSSASLSRRLPGSAADLDAVKVLVEGVWVVLPAEDPPEGGRQSCYSAVRRNVVRDAQLADAEQLVVANLLADVPDKLADEVAAQGGSRGGRRASDRRSNEGWQTRPLETYRSMCLMASKRIPGEGKGSAGSDG